MDKFVIYKDDRIGTDQCWRWRLIDTNGRNIARSEEAFLRENVSESIQKMQASVISSTPIVEDGSEEEKGADWRFAYFKSDKDNKWHWRLQAAGNNETMAIGVEGFDSKGNVIRSIENVRDKMQSADIDGDVKEPTKKDEKTNIKKGIPGS